MAIQTIEQQRAKKALEDIQKVTDLKDEKIKKEFLSYANEFPAMIHMNGLGQAVAFYRSKDDTHQKLYKVLSDWLCGDDKIYASGDLLKNITDGDMSAYRMAQTEAQAYLVWLKSFARAYLKENKGV
ncbi:MAG: type III-B CRISPR module-associated protein Cmr5 [Alcanivoracaceae bacterium]|nr:type III-B CRISPR module-associated protein Cmr5 [Alcanivoracaceae bacterium]